MSDIFCVKAVIFDMDGLMFDTERLAAKGMGDGIAAQGFEADAATLHDTLGINYESTRKVLAARYGEGLDYPAVMRRMDEYIDEYVHAHGTPVKDGLIELLDALDARSIPRAVASSSPMYRVMSNIRCAGLEGRFPVIVTGDMIARSKPEPDIFLEAARRLGVAPRDCLVCEDSQNGVEAGKRAGMKTVMVPDRHMPDDRDKAGLFALVGSLADVIPMLGGTAQRA